MGEIISVESQSQQMEDPGFESKSDFRALALNNNASFVPGIYYTFDDNDADNINNNS
jgi:hypothetical protein